MKDYLKTIQDNLRRLRKEKGLAQRDVGDIMGIKQAQYNRLESSDQEPNLNSLFRASQALEVPLIELFRDTNLANLPENQLLKRVLDLPESEREPLMKVIASYLKEYETKRTEERMQILAETRANKDKQ